MARGRGRSREEGAPARGGRGGGLVGQQSRGRGSSKEYTWVQKKNDAEGRCTSIFRKI